MADGDSIGGVLKDLAKETVKQIANVPIGIATGAVSQVLTLDSEEKEAKKKAEKAMTFQRIKQIEAEMAQIRAMDLQKNQSQNPQGPKTNSGLGVIETKKNNKTDEASRQAVGRAEQGRNFKG